jgi:hypothetical protein
MKRESNVIFNWRMKRIYWAINMHSHLRRPVAKVYVRIGCWLFRRRQIKLGMIWFNNPLIAWFDGYDPGGR